MSKLEGIQLKAPSFTQLGPQATLFTMPRALAIVAAIQTILHSYVNAELAQCLPGYDWVR